VHPAGGARRLPDNPILTSCVILEYNVSNENLTAGLHDAVRFFFFGVCGVSPKDYQQELLISGCAFDDVHFGAKDEE
jgi:hypothetical protein